MSDSLFKRMVDVFNITEEELLDMRIDTARVSLEDKMDASQKAAFVTLETYDILDFNYVSRIYSDFMEEYNTFL